MSLAAAISVEKDDVCLYHMKILLEQINEADVKKEKSDKPVRFLQSIERPSRTWDYDGKRILGHVGDIVCLWEATSGKLIHKMEGHKEHIFGVQFSPDGRHGLSSSWVSPGGRMYKSKDTRTILWDLTTGNDQMTFPDQVAGEFSPDGERIVTFSLRPDQLLSSFDAIVWDAFQGRQLCKTTLGDYSSPPFDALHFSSDGRSFAHITPAAFELYDANTGRETGKIVARDGTRLYTSNGELALFDSKKAVLMSPKTGQVAKSVPHHLGALTQLPAGGAVWTHDGSRVATVGGGEKIQVLDIATGKVSIGAESGPYPLHTFIVSPDNSRLAIEWGGANNVEPGVGIFNMTTGNEIARIKVAEWGHMIGFAPDSRTLLVGGSEFVIYDTDNGKKIRSLKLLDDVSFAPDWNN
jgi:WD40 repeat protein